MHSILGLAASELIASDASLAEAAMAHRLKSIQAIKRKLADSNQGITYAEGNALIATCFALTFQSVILEDGSKQLPQDKPRPGLLCTVPTSLPVLVHTRQGRHCISFPYH